MHDVFEGVLILTIVLLNAILGYFQENKAERALEALKKIAISTVRVQRDSIQREIDSRSRTIVGVNDYVDSKPVPIPLLELDPIGQSRQVERLRNLRLERDNGRVGQALDRLRLACRGTENTMPFLLDCVRAYATLGEIVSVMKAVFGVYNEPTWI